MHKFYFRLAARYAARLEVKCNAYKFIASDLTRLYPRLQGVIHSVIHRIWG